MLHNHKPATIRRLGLDYDSVSRISPALVYCATYGYGERGCYAGKGAFDDSVQAAAGIAALLETVSGTPGYVPTLVADKTTALFVVQAVLAALFHRERTGEGQAIEVPMFESTVAWLMVEHLWGQSFDPALGQMAYPRLLAEFRRPYRCRDGRFLAVLPYRDPHWRAFCEIADRSELINDERFSTLAARTENIEGTYRITSEIVALKSREEWLDLLGPTSIPATPVNTLEELVDDPHLDAAGFWRFVDHPEEGRLRMPAYPVNFGATPATIRRPPPRLGEHSVEILREAGFDEVRIRQMLEAGETGGNGG